METHHAPWYRPYAGNLSGEESPSVRYRRTKRDANHVEIVAALKAAGCTVVDLAATGGGVPDLLVGVRGRNLLLEVKNPNRRRKDGTLMGKGVYHAEVADRQADFRANWTGQAAVVYSVEEALHQVGCV